MPPRAETTKSPEQAATPDADVVIAGDGFEFQPSEAEAAAGTVSVALTSEVGMHTVTFELDTGDKTVAQVFGGGTDVGEIELEAGTYTFYCAIPNHRENGMEGTLTVS